MQSCRAWTEIKVAIAKAMLIHCSTLLLIAPTFGQAWLRLKDLDQLRRLLINTKNYDREWISLKDNPVLTFRAAVS